MPYQCGALVRSVIPREIRNYLLILVAQVGAVTEKIGSPIYQVAATRRFDLSAHGQRCARADHGRPAAEEMTTQRGRDVDGRTTQRDDALLPPAAFRPIDVAGISECQPFRDRRLKRLHAGKQADKIVFATQRQHGVDKIISNTGFALLDLEAISEEVEQFAFTNAHPQRIIGDQPNDTKRCATKGSRR